MPVGVEQHRPRLLVLRLGLEVGGDQVQVIVRLGARREGFGRYPPGRRHDDVDPITEQPCARLQRQRDAFDDDIGTGMLPPLVTDCVDPARHPLAEPVIGVLGQKMPVAFEHLLARRGHLGRAEAGIDA